MIEPTPEMEQAFERGWNEVSKLEMHLASDLIRGGLTEALALVERDYEVRIRQGERCFCGADLGPPWDTTPHRIGTPGCRSAS